MVPRDHLGAIIERNLAPSAQALCRVLHGDIGPKDAIIDKGGINHNEGMSRRVRIAQQKL